MIHVLREYLRKEFSFRDAATDFEPDFERCVDDFVLMCFFVGNDFLPHLPSLSIHKGSIDQMLLLYQKVSRAGARRGDRNDLVFSLQLRPLMSDYLTNAGTINRGCLEVFVSHLGKVEEIVFQQELRRQVIISWSVLHCLCRNEPKLSKNWISRWLLPKKQNKKRPLSWLSTRTLPHFVV